MYKYIYCVHKMCVVFRLFFFSFFFARGQELRYYSFINPQQHSLYSCVNVYHKFPLF